jgi:hypothetical protein
MDESSYLRLLQNDPDNEQIRADYFALLVQTGDHLAKYVELYQERLDLQARLQQIEAHLAYFGGLTEEWLEIVFPLRIRSETVGRVYLRPKPDSPPFVKQGQMVAPDTVVCYIEVMRTLNEVTAGVCGVIDKVEVSDGDAVEFNQVMFRLKPRPTSEFVVGVGQKGVNVGSPRFSERNSQSIASTWPL